MSVGDKLLGRKWGREFFRGKSRLSGHHIRGVCLQITFPAAVMFEGGTNVPTNFAVLPEGSACIGGDMGDNPGARWGEWSAVEVKVPKK
jgi:hypothetical protein